MSSPAPCVPQCCNSTPQVVNTPGPTGNSAVTVTTASFVIPAIAATVLIPSSDTSWFKANTNLLVNDGANEANFIVTAVNSATSFTGKFLGMNGDSAAGTTIQSGAIVTTGPGNFTVPNDLDLLTAFTDNSGGTKSDTIAANVARQTLVFGPWNMTTLANAQNWNIAVPFAFTLLSLTFRCDAAITTGAKSATFTPAIAGVNTGGGTLVVSGTYAVKATQALNPSAPNTGTAGQTIELPVSAVTAFTEGYGHIEAVVRNDDLNATIAAIAFKANQLRTALRHQ
jgi:hypothetical protein